MGYSQKKAKIKIIHADRGTGGELRGEPVNKLYGRVHLQRGDVDFYCDSAIRYVKRNDFNAYGHVRMVKKNAITLTSKKLLHKGKTGVSRFTGNVVLRDKKMTLKTENLDYNKNTDLAYYYGGGVVNDDKVRLVSKTGVYSVSAKFFNFYTDVKVTQPGNVITSDTLRYNRLSGVVYFEGPTVIKSQLNDLYAEKGKYNTKTEDAYFSKNAVVETPKYVLKGDSLFFNNKSTDGYVLGNVIIQSKKDSLFIFGDEAIRNGVAGTMKVSGERALMEKINGIDTTFILADTLYAIEDTASHQQEQIFAYNNVEIYKNELQASCDSLVNDFKDSTIYFYKKPVVWNGDNQISGDTIKVVSVKKQIDKAYTNGHSFIVKQHHGVQYDQIKGRQTVAYFKNNDIAKVRVLGNGECLYYLNDEEDKTFTGVNRIECSEMKVRFKNKELSDVTFLSLPNAHFYPPQLLTPAVSFLKDFIWEEEKRPLLREFRAMHNKYIPLPKEIIEEVVEDDKIEKEVIEESLEEFLDKSKQRKARKKEKKRKKKELRKKKNLN